MRKHKTYNITYKHAYRILLRTCSRRRMHIPMYVCICVFLHMYICMCAHVYTAACLLFVVNSLFSCLPNTTMSEFRSCLISIINCTTVCTQACGQPGRRPRGDPRRRPPPRPFCPVSKDALHTMLGFCGQACGQPGRRPRGDPRRRPPPRPPPLL